MALKDDWKKNCIKCRRIIPYDDKICEFCGYRYLDYKLTRKNSLLPLSKLIAEINQGFFLLESYMRGDIKTYDGFDFVDRFEVLFAKLKQPQNYRPNNLELLWGYFGLMSQIRFDAQHKNFENMEAGNNEDFNIDIHNLGYLIRLDYGGFSDFVTDDASKDDKKPLTISDIAKSYGMKVTIDTATLPNRKVKLNVVPTKKVIDIYNLLKDYFPQQEAELLHILSGQQLEKKLHFPNSQNKLAEVFRRLKINGFIANSLTDIATLLSENFTFLYTKGKLQQIKPMSLGTLKELIVKGKNLPPEKSKICKVDWLPL